MNTIVEVNQLRAELYAMLLLSNRFNKESIVFKTENKHAANRFVSLLSMIFNPIIDKVEPKDKNKSYVIRVVDSNDCLRIYEFFGHDDRELSLRVNRAFVDSEDEIRSFVRGAFLSCGSISNPEKDYHLEFSIQKNNLCSDICHIIREIPDALFNIKMITRNGSYMAYLKDSEQITDLLAYIGATNAAMEIMGTKALKEVRNKVNRKANSEFANLKKQSTAAAVQIKAINDIKESGRFSELSDELKDIANLRLENPDMSLSELGKMLTPPLSRSGVNHRLEKILKLAGG